MNTSSARSYIVRLSVTSAVACAAWYFGIRPMRDGLDSMRASLEAVHAEIEEGQALELLSSQDPAAAIERLEGSANALKEYWGLSADASVLYESIDTIASRYGVMVERMEPRRTPVSSKRAVEGIDEPMFNQIVYSMDLIGSYEGVARFLRAIQTEIGMSRIDSVRLGPALSQDGPTHVRASVLSTHFQSQGGLAAFSEAEGEAP